jgi:hypothetical protein
MQFNPSAQSFKSTKYTLKIFIDASGNTFSGILTIEGLKLPPPSRRITLNQRGLKVKSAEIIYKGKKGDQEFKIARINHLNTFEEVRIHTQDMLYPGQYILRISYTGKFNKTKIAMLSNPNTWENMSWRDILPCNDETSRRSEATLEFIAT